MNEESTTHGTHHLDAVYDAVLFDWDDVVTNPAGQVYPSTAAFLRRLRDAAVPVGLVTVNPDAQQMLAAGDLASSFDTVVDGRTALTHHLPVKPDPAMSVEAARRLGVPPSRTAIVEGSVAGVTAGRG